jgi:hypothetical protein
MNQTFASIAVAMMVPAVAVIFVVVHERKSVPEEPAPAELVLVIPALANLHVPVVTRRRWSWLRSKARRPNRIVE